MKIRFVDPSELFYSHGPVVRQHPLSDYYDRDEIGVSTYLQVLPSIALYGFKYAVPVSKSGKLLDGNFRVFCAEELGMKVPIVVCKNNSEDRTRLGHKILWIIRKLIGRNYFLKRKWKNPRFNKKFDHIPSYCLFQENILDEIKEKPYQKQLKILFIWDTAGVGSDLADYINSNHLGKAYVIHRQQYDPLYFTRRFVYNQVPKCSTLRFVLIVIKHLLFFKPDVIHINAWIKGAIIAKLFSKAKIVFQFHGSNLRGRRIPWFIRKFSDEILVSTKDLVRKDTKLLSVPIA